VAGRKGLHLEKEERSTAILASKSSGPVLLANETKDGTGLISCPLKRRQTHIRLMTGDFANQNKGLPRVDGGLASPRGVFG